MTINKWLKFRKGKIMSKILYCIFRNKGLDLPYNVILGKNVSFPHNSVGTVIHNSTVIGNNVKIYQNVTLGRADIWKESTKSEMKGFLIEDGAVLCAGVKVLCKKGTLRVGKNTIIGANAVLTKSTGDNEIWAGIPARKIGNRDDI